MARPFQYIRYGLVLISMVLTPVSAWAEVMVIYDSGDTQSLAPYLEIIDRTEAVTDRSPMTGVTNRGMNISGLGAADVQALLPIRSLGLSPGAVQAKSHNRPFSRPFFLIGSDDRSRQWLVEYRDRLKEIGAVGMLVQAETLEDLQTIAQLAGGLPIMPASASDIATALGISHYPVLITSHGIEQ